MSITYHLDPKKKGIPEELMTALGVKPGSSKSPVTVVKEEEQSEDDLFNYSSKTVAVIGNAKEATLEMNLFKSKTEERFPGLIPLPRTRRRPV